MPHRELVVCPPGLRRLRFFVAGKAAWWLCGECFSAMIHNKGTENTKLTQRPKDYSYRLLEAVRLGRCRPLTHGPRQVYHFHNDG